MAQFPVSKSQAGLCEYETDKPMKRLYSASGSRLFGLQEAIGEEFKLHWGWH